MKTIVTCVFGLLLALAFTGCKKDAETSEEANTAETTDPIPECSGDGTPCGDGRTCVEDDDDLRGGYCSPDCNDRAPFEDCPSGTVCLDDGLCMVLCEVDSDCPRSYQVCVPKGRRPNPPYHYCESTY